MCEFPHRRARRHLAAVALLATVLIAAACSSDADEPALVASGGDGGSDSVGEAVDSTTTSSSTTTSTTTTAAPTTTLAPTTTSTSTTEAPPEQGQVTCENGVVVTYELPADGSTPTIDDLCSDVDDGEPDPLLAFCRNWWPESDISPCIDAGGELFAACMAQADPAAEESIAMGFVAECLVAGEELLGDDELFGMCGADHYPVVTDDGTTCVPFEQPETSDDE